MSHNSKTMENENELDNSENIQEGGEPSEKVAEDLTPKLKELEEKNKQLFERAKKAEEKLKEIKPLAEPKEEPKGTIQNDPKTMVRLSKALGSFDEDEIDFIYQIAKDSTPEAIIEASKSDWVQTAITAKREKVAKEKQIPEPGNLSGAPSLTGLTPEDIQKDPVSHKKAWEKHMKNSGLSQEVGI